MICDFARAIITMAALKAKARPVPGNTVPLRDSRKPPPDVVAVERNIIKLLYFHSLTECLAIPVHEAYTSVRLAKVESEVPEGIRTTED